VADEPTVPDRSSQSNANFIELAIRVSLIGFLVYWTFLLVRPFITIMVWSVALAVALYPIFGWLAAFLGGRRVLAAVLITIIGLFVVIGPVTWMGVGLIDALKTLIERLDSGELTLPPPPDQIKDWPIVGPQIHEYWSFASANLRSAFASLLPQLKPYGEVMLDAARSAGAGTLKFFASVIITGFLFAPGPRLVAATKDLARKIDPGHGETFVELAAATIHAVSRGVIGLSLMQAVIGGVGMWLADAPGASLLTVAILVLGIIQIGPLILVAPLVLWAWTTMATGPAIAFTACMLTVNYMDNVLKPFLLARGLTTPIPVVFIGVIGGVLAHGVVGLFVGPVVLAVAWELAMAWMRDGEAPA
jgi:predicted PurR-regulated permease PerM